MFASKMNYLKILSVNPVSSHIRNKILQNCIRPAFESFRRGYSYDGDGKTSASILNHGLDLGLLINSYSPHGFRLSNKFFVQGSLVVFPSTAFSWQVDSIEDACEEAFSLFPIVQPHLDILVIGVGDKENWTRGTQVTLQRMMSKHGVAVEVLPTDQACSTYNFLAVENRFVAAALIPPMTGYNLAEDRFRSDEAFNIFA